MAVSLKHTFQSTAQDGTRADMLQPSHWNADHDTAELQAVLDSLQTQLPTTESVVTDTPLIYLQVGKHNIIKDQETPADYAVYLPFEGLVDGSTVSIEIHGTVTKLITITDDDNTGIDGLESRVMWAKETATLRFNATDHTWTKIAGKSVPMIAFMYATSTPTVTTSPSTTKVTTNENYMLVTTQDAMCDTTNQKIIIKRDGLYVVRGQVMFGNSNTSQGIVETQIYKNGTMFGTNTNQSIASKYQVSMLIQPPYKYVVGDYFECYAYYDTGSYLGDLYVNDDRSHIMVMEQITW